MKFDWGVFWSLLLSGTFLIPAWTTFWITCASMTMGIVLGLLGALGLLSRAAAVRWLVHAYLWVFRGTPVLVQIIFWYDATAELTNNAINLPVLVAGVIALGVNAHWATGQHSVAGSTTSGGHANVYLLGRSVFTTYLYAFEATAALLVIAVVGAVVLARRPQRVSSAEETTQGATEEATDPQEVTR